MGSIFNASFLNLEGSPKLSIFSLISGGDHPFGLFTGVDVINGMEIVIVNPLTITTFKKFIVTPPEVYQHPVSP